MSATQRNLTTAFFANLTVGAVSSKKAGDA